MQDQDKITFRFQAVLRTFPCMLVTELSLCQNVYDYLTRIDNACRAGVGLIQFREKLKVLSRSDKLTLANKVRCITQKQGSLMIVNTDVSLAVAVNADGIHFSETSTCTTTNALNNFFFSDRSKNMILGRSIHSFKQIFQQDNILLNPTYPYKNVDYVLFGHIFQTPSKPNTPAQGIEKLQACVEASSHPVFAIGGITHENLYRCVKVGAKGFAVMSSLLQGSNYIDIVQQLKSAYSNCLQTKEY